MQHDDSLRLWTAVIERLRLIQVVKLLLELLLVLANFMSGRLDECNFVVREELTSLILSC